MAETAPYSPPLMELSHGEASQNQITPGISNVSVGGITLDFLPTAEQFDDVLIPIADEIASWQQTCSSITSESQLARTAETLVIIQDNQHPALIELLTQTRVQVISCLRGIEETARNEASTKLRNASGYDSLKPFLQHEIPQDVLEDPRFMEKIYVRINQLAIIAVQKMRPKRPAKSAAAAATTAKDQDFSTLHKEILSLKKSVQKLSASGSTDAGKQRKSNGKKKENSTTKPAKKASRKPGGRQQS